MAPPNPQDILAQVKRLQLEKARGELAEEAIEVSVGGGAVRVRMSGVQECLGVEIKPDVLAGGDAEMVQDLMQSAINQAIRESQALAARRLGPLTGGLPGL
jgi:DNA-binding YbaB/EbfC family protein